MGSILKSVAAGVALSLFASGATAGDWREFTRVSGAAVALDASGVLRTGSQLSVDMVVALLPERQLPLYGIVRVSIDCETMRAAIGGAQFYLANGDPFGDRTDGMAGEDYAGDDIVADLCGGVLPPGPGAESALAFFKSTQAPSGAAD